MQMEMNKGLGHGYRPLAEKRGNGVDGSVAWTIWTGNWDFLGIERLGMSFPFQFLHSDGLVLEPVPILAGPEDPDTHGIPTVIDGLQLVIDLAYFLRNVGLDADHTTPTPSYEARNNLF